MKITRKTTVFVKTERRFVVKGQPPEELVLCGQCSEQMLQAQMSADFFNIGIREIFRLIESGKIHFVETPDNEIYVCTISVGKLLNITD